MDGDLGSLQRFVPEQGQALGLFRGLDAQTYHSSPGVSQSRLKTFVEPGGPALYRANIRKDTSALKFGGILHTATLEPHLLDHQYAPTDLDRIGTKAWEEAERRAGGRILVKRPDWERAQRMRDAVLSHPTARQFFTAETEIETSMFWIDPDTGLLCRGRADILRRDWRVMGDIKSCVDASQMGFENSITEWGYDWQDAFYRRGYSQATGGQEIDTFVFLAIEKDFPHLIGVYDIDPDTITAAAVDIDRALGELKTCIDTDTWPGLPPELTRLTPRANRKRRSPYS